MEDTENKTKKEEKTWEILLNTPNLISYTRVALLIPIIFVYPNRLLTLLLLGIAALSDWLDGFIARAQNESTSIGAIIDPLTDKIFFTGLVVFFFMKQQITLFQLLVFFLRDFFIVGLIGFTLLLGLLDRRMLRMKKLLKAGWASKITTALIFVALAWVMIGIPYFEYFVFVILLSSVVTMIDYSIIYSRKMSTI